MRLELLGEASLLRPDGRPSTGRAVQKHNLALLALLVRSRGRSLARPHLLDLLWPDLDGPHGRHRLNVALHHLREVLGHDTLTSEGNRIRLAPASLSCDALDFEEALRAGDLPTAVALYRGPFLEGFRLNGCEELERWIDDERSDLTLLHREALRGLALMADARSDTAGAIGWRRSLLRTDPYAGDTVLQLMRNLVATGDRAGALQAARAYASRLRDDLEMEPDGEIVALIAEIRRGAPPASP